VGIEQSFYWNPLSGQDWRWEFVGGYRFDSVATEGSEFDRLVNNYYVGTRIPLPNLVVPEKDASFQFAVAWQVEDYRNRSLIDRTHDRRHDVIRIFSWSLSQPLIHDVNYGDLTLHAIINWMDSDSNVVAEDHSEPFTYDKVVYGLQLEWAW
jgi:hypothetical protein